MKTKVWIVIWGLKDGGAEVLARNYASLVDPQTFDATVVTMYPFEDTANYRHAKNAGIRILSVFRKRNTLTRMVRLLFGNWYVPLALKKMLAKEKPNTIHFNSKMLPYFTSLTKELSGIRLLYTCHNEVPVYFSGEEKRAAEYLMKNTDMRLIALHDDMKAELNQTFSKNDTVVIRNGIDLNRFRNATCGRNEMRQALGIDQEAYLVGHIGMFAKEKKPPKSRKTTCAVCERVAGQMDNCLENCVWLLEKEPDFLEKYLASEGVCLHHFYELTSKMGRGSGKLYEKLHAHMQEKLERLAGDIDSFTRSFDYRNTPGANMGAVPGRAVETLTEKKG